MPLHKRKWCVEDVPDAETLAHELKRHAALTLCTGFRLQGYLLLNDATHEDAAQEFAVLKEPTLTQIESLTISWMNFDDVCATIQATVAGDYDRQTLATFVSVTPDQIETPAQHGRCRYCE